MGDEYPGTLCEGDDTAPNSAPSHSCSRLAIVASGRETPVFWNSSNPAAKATNSKLHLLLLVAAACMTRCAAGITSRPIPSAGISPILNLLSLLAVDFDDVVVLANLLMIIFFFFLEK